MFFFKLLCILGTLSVAECISQNDSAITSASEPPHWHHQKPVFQEFPLWCKGTEGVSTVAGTQVRSLALLSGVKDPLLQQLWHMLQLWLRFDPWPGNSMCSEVAKYIYIYIYTYTHTHTHTYIYIESLYSIPWPSTLLIPALSSEMPRILPCCLDQTHLGRAFWASRTSSPSSMACKVPT